MSQIASDRQQEDLRWAFTDSDVQENYKGEYVVPFQRRIVAHGTDLETVLDEAVRVTGKQAHELPHCVVLDPLEDIPE